MLLAWNELSELPLAANRVDALARMNGFVDTFARLRVRLARIVARPVMRCHRALDEVELAPDYRIAHWRRDTDPTRRSLLLFLTTASPTLPSAQEGGSDDQYASEAKHRGRDARGLHAAWVWDGLGLSLASDTCWGHSKLDLEITELSDGGATVCFDASVRHASAPNHVDEHEAWIVDVVRTAIVGPEDLWRRRNELFPALEFCPEVEARLARFGGGSPHFRQILLRLFELDRAFASWDGRPLHPEFVPTKCSPETPQTLKEEEAQHTFTRHDGAAVLFSWHVRFTPDAGRIFFEGALTPQPRGVIGYIGLKKGTRLT